VLHRSRSQVRNPFPRTSETGIIPVHEYFCGPGSPIVIRCENISICTRAENRQILSACYFLQRPVKRKEVARFTQRSDNIDGLMARLAHYERNDLVIRLIQTGTNQ